MKNPNPDDLRREFWALPDSAFVTRDMAAAAVFLSKSSLEAFAVKGGGPKYLARGRGRSSLYLKSDLIAWIMASGRSVQATAELEMTKE